jgi:hypothetical protein
MDLGISGRNALVCAGSKGLGRACAYALVREGVNVVIVARNPERIARALSLLREKGPRGTHRKVAVCEYVLTDPLDDFFREPGEFLIMRERKRLRTQGNSSVYRWTAGAHADVLEYFRANLDAVRTQHRNEQEFLVDHLTRQGKVRYWPETWCRSFKRHCVHPFPFSLFRVPSIPADARIIVFHGLPNPPDALVGRSGKWYRRVLPTPWISQHWR